MKYRNTRLKFEIDFPEGWKRPGFLHRLSRLPLRLIFSPPDVEGGPEFYGPRGVTIKLAIGSISPEPNVEQHQKSIASMAERHGHRVLKVDTIEVAEKSHATMVVDMPVPGGSRRVKNYFLIFKGTEYVITSTLESGEEACDAIVKTLRSV